MATWLGLIYAGTVFVSAFLLFQVQPMISKYILPWFGGSPAVWTTCMFFFQTLLFCGYVYAHVSEHYLKPVLAGAGAPGVDRRGAAAVADHAGPELEAAGQRPRPRGGFSAC